VQQKIINEVYNDDVVEKTQNDRIKFHNLQTQDKDAIIEKLKTENKLLLQKYI